MIFPHFLDIINSTFNYNFIIYIYCKIGYTYLGTICAALGSWGPGTNTNLLLFCRLGNSSINSAKAFKPSESKNASFTYMYNLYICRYNYHIQ